MAPGDKTEIDSLAANLVGRAVVLRAEVEVLQQQLAVCAARVS